MELEDVTEAKLTKKRGGGDAKKNGNNSDNQENCNEGNYGYFE